MSLKQVMYSIGATPEQEGEYCALPLGEPRRLKMLEIMQNSGLSKEEMIKRTVEPNHGQCV